MGVLDFVGGWNEKLGSCCGASLEGGNRGGIDGLPNGDSPKTPAEGLYHRRRSKAARSGQGNNWRTSAIICGDDSAVRPTRLGRPFIL